MNSNKGNNIFTNNHLKRKFKFFFQDQKSIKISKIQELIQNSDKSTLKIQLKEWNIYEYFEIKDDLIIRNSVPTKWCQFKNIISYNNEKIFEKCFSLAINIITQIKNFKQALDSLNTPIFLDIINKIKNLGIKITDDTKKKIENVIYGESKNDILAIINQLKKNNKNYRKSTEETQRRITISIIEIIYPYINANIKILSNLQNEHNNFYEFLEDWMDEQYFKLEKLSKEEKKKTFYLDDNKLFIIEKELIDNIVEIATSISQNHKIIQQALQNFQSCESYMILIFKEINLSSLIFQSVKDLIQISRIQFQFNILHHIEQYPYNDELFIKTIALEETFTDFIHNNNERSLFLLLGRYGMGKTWNATYLGRLTQLENSAIPLIITLDEDYELQLSQIFKYSDNSTIFANDIGQTCKIIYENKKKKILFIFDGLNYLPSSKMPRFLNFMKCLLVNYNHYINILLTDTVANWTENDFVLKANLNIDNYIYQNNKLDAIKHQDHIETNLSGYCLPFNDKQIQSCINSYQLNINNFTPALFNSCKNPYIFRIIKERNDYPDPENPSQFCTYFYNEEDPSSSILSKLGIKDEILTFFFRILNEFEDNQEKSYYDLSELIIEDEYSWKIILYSGLIIELFNEFNSTYTINPHYSRIIDFIKHRLFFHKILGLDAIQRKNLSKAKEIFDKTFEQAIRSKNQVLIDKNIRLLAQVDCAINEFKKLESNIDNIPQKMDLNQWNEAKNLILNSKEICQKYNWVNDEINFSLLIENCDKHQKITKIEFQKERIRLAKLKRKQFDLDKLEKQKELNKKIEAVRLEKIQKQQKIDERLKIEKEEQEKRLQLKKQELELEQLKKLDAEKNMEVIYYHDISLIRRDVEVLLALEKKTNKQIPQVNSVTQKTFGFVSESNKIIKLGISNLALDVLPENIGNLKSLKELWINKNNLVALPESIGKLESLERLQGYNNKLTSIPESIKNLKSLKHLSLSINKLSLLPDAIGNLNSLENLYLKNNNIVFLPKSMGNLTSLKKLWVTNNKISSLPEDLEKLENLKNIDFYNNNLSNISQKIENWFEKLKSNGCVIIK